MSVDSISGDKKNLFMIIDFNFLLVSNIELIYKQFGWTFKNVIIMINIELWNACFRMSMRFTEKRKMNRP